MTGPFKENVDRIVAGTEAQNKIGTPRHICVAVVSFALDDDHDQPTWCRLACPTQRKILKEVCCLVERMTSPIMKGSGGTPLNGVASMEWPPWWVLLKAPAIACN